MKNTEDLTPEENSVEESLLRLQPADISETLLTELQTRMNESSQTDSDLLTMDDSTILHESASRGVSMRTFLWTIAAILMVGFYLGWGIGRSSLSLKTEPSMAGSEPITQPSNSDHIKTASHSSSLNEHETVLRNQQLRHVKDDGVVLSVGHTPMKRLRYEFVDTYVWEPSADGGLMRMEVPREDFVLVPVSTY